MRVFFVMILICDGLICMAQKSSVTKPTVSNSPKLESTLLWEISGNGLKKPSYLFGTMHLLCEADAQMSDSLRYTISQAGKIYFEIDMDNMAEMLGVLRYVRMNDNKKLTDLLSTKDYQKVKTYFSAHPSLLPFSMMERFKPFFITAFMEQQQMPCETQDGMETVIMGVAKKQGKEIKGLETIKFQASVFDSIPYELQAQELLKAIDSADVEKKSSSELVRVYRDQNLNRIQEMTVQDEMGVTGALDLLLYDRNARWVTAIDTITKTNNCLFAVGAAHLPGEKGVINLLRKKGYILRPMLHEVRTGELAQSD